MKSKSLFLASALSLAIVPHTSMGASEAPKSVPSLIPDAGINSKNPNGKLGNSINGAPGKPAGGVGNTGPGPYGNLPKSSKSASEDLKVPTKPSSEVGMEGITTAPYAPAPSASGTRSSFDGVTALPSASAPSASGTRSSFGLTTVPSAPAPSDSGTRSTF